MSMVLGGYSGDNDDSDTTPSAWEADPTPTPEHIRNAPPTWKDWVTIGFFLVVMFAIWFRWP